MSTIHKNIGGKGSVNGTAIKRPLSHTETVTIGNILIVRALNALFKNQSLACKIAQSDSRSVCRLFQTNWCPGMCAFVLFYNFKHTFATQQFSFAAWLSLWGSHCSSDPRGIFTLLSCLSLYNTTTLHLYACHLITSSLSTSSRHSSFLFSSRRKYYKDLTKYIWTSTKKSAQCTPVIDKNENKCIDKYKVR